MAESMGWLSPGALRAEDSDLLALRQAAVRAEEAAAKIEVHAVAKQSFSSLLEAELAFPIPWTSPLTPDDSAEEFLDLSKFSSAGNATQQASAANHAPVPGQKPLISTNATASGKKRGRPRKQNLVDSIISQSIEGQLLVKRGRPSGSKKQQIGRDSPAPSAPFCAPAKPHTAPLSHGFQRFAALSGDLESAGNPSNVHLERTASPGDFGRQPSILTAALHSSPVSGESRRKVSEANSILKSIFNDDIAPVMHSSMSAFEGKLPRDVLVSVGRAFADEVLNRRLRTAVQSGHYTVTLRDKQIAKGTIDRMLNQKLKDLHVMPLSAASSSLDVMVTPASGSELRRSGNSAEMTPASGDLQRKVDAIDHGSSRSGEVHTTVISSLPVPQKAQTLQLHDEQFFTASSHTGAPSASPLLQSVRSQRLGSRSSYTTRDSPETAHIGTPFAPDVTAENQSNSKQNVHASKPLAAPRWTYSEAIDTVPYEHDFSYRPLLQASEHSSRSGNTMLRRFARQPKYVHRESLELGRPPASDHSKNRRGSLSDGASVSGTAAKPTRAAPVTLSTLSARSMTSSARIPISPISAPAPSSDIPLKVQWALGGCNIDSMIRQRELGFGRWYTGEFSVKSINQKLGMDIAGNLRCWRSWTGASKDVLTTIWAPNGCTFAAGASTEMDNMNIQYNRPNNLLLGNFELNTLTEVPDHYINRPTPEQVASGENSRVDTYNSVDPELYTTISGICFNDESSRMFTGSFDKTAKIWSLDVKEQPSCINTLTHDAEVDLLAASYGTSKLLASGQRSTKGAIRVYSQAYVDKENYKEPSQVFESTRASRNDVYPTCLLWGPTSYTSNLLLAGFAESNSDGSRQDQQGDLCLWDIETGKSYKLQPAAQAVHDITWHPSLPLFAAATVPGNRKGLSDPYNTKSVIRTWEPFQGPSRVIEYECPALDINDVRFHPYDDHYIIAGCTNGVTYVWDARNPDTLLHCLRHGEPIDELDHYRSREKQDTGVRFTGWDKYGKYLYTGSSDGVIAAWNILTSPEDALVKNVAQFDAGVMTGTFSPDYSNLLVGLSKGAVHILSTTPLTHDSNEDLNEDHNDKGSSNPPKPYDTITYIPAPRITPEEPPSGIEAANYLVATGQIVMHPILGAGKGPNYQGPYASYARLMGADPITSLSTIDDLDPDIQASQLDPLERRKGKRLGGFVNRETRAHYRNAQKVAHERNFLPLRFKEGKRAATKRLVDEEVDKEKEEDIQWEGGVKVKVRREHEIKAMGRAGGKKKRKQKQKTALGGISPLAGYDIWDDAVVRATRSETDVEVIEGKSDTYRGGGSNQGRDLKEKACAIRATGATEPNTSTRAKKPDQAVTVKRCVLRSSPATNMWEGCELIILEDD
ncbi:hypothetical protein MMC13_006018 [Lambiella insularis]|nr:hypothetical protein [Lambiella insularis]